MTTPLDYYICPVSHERLQEAAAQVYLALKPAYHGAGRSPDQAVAVLRDLLEEAYRLTSAQQTDKE